jgi:F-type H+-transporting ATPase subunit b
MLGGILCAVALGFLDAPLAFAASEGDGGGMISVDWSLLVQMVNFLALLFVLHRILYKPFLAKMEERTEAIRKSLDEAQAARAEATRQQEENAARLRAAHQEAAAIREHALRDAAEEARKQIEQAQGQARKLVDDTRAQLDTEVRRARDELRREVAELATAVAEKLVRRSLRDDDHRRIIADAIARISS